MGEERMRLEMAAGSGGGGFRLAPAAEEVQSDLMKRRFIGSVRFIFFLSHVSGFSRFQIITEIAMKFFVFTNFTPSLM